MGTGSSAARGFEGVDPAKRQQAPPPQRYADPARYDWIPVEGDPDPADVASASEAPPDLAAPDDDSAARRPGRTPFRSRASRSTPSSRATTPRRPSCLRPPQRAARIGPRRGAPAATGDGGNDARVVCAQNHTRKFTKIASARTSTLAACKTLANWAPAQSTQHRA